MERIGIIGALDEEIVHYLSELSEPVKTTASGFAFYDGKLAGKDVVVVKCGAGKVNAATCTQLLIGRFGVSCIIFTGVAGALNPSLGIKDMVISRDSIQHDVDATGLGFEKGEIPYSKIRVIDASAELGKLAYSEARRLGLNIIHGRMLSGDQFITDHGASKRLRDEFHGDCVDMESAAVAHVCKLNNVPHLIIRSISDRADKSASVDFKAFCMDASKNSFSLVRSILAKMDTKGPDRLARIKSRIRTVPDWPKKGVMFRDITTVLKDKEAFNDVMELLVERYSRMDIDLVAGIESRGFITGSALANRLGVGFVPIRKAGKLPAKTVSMEYALEYGKDRIEMHEDSIAKGAKVLLVDDLIATGGTALAACELIRKLGGDVVECSFMIDLYNLGGKKKLAEKGYKTFSLVEMEG